jgi:hypothetical protein
LRVNEANSSLCTPDKMQFDAKIFAGHTL